MKQWQESMQKAQDSADVESFLHSSAGRWASFMSSDGLREGETAGQEGESSAVKQLRLNRPRKIYVDEAPQRLLSRSSHCPAGSHHVPGEASDVARMRSSAGERWTPGTRVASWM